MIQPINALSPKVFRGELRHQKMSEKEKTARNVALMNAGGIATIIGAGTVIGARNYTSTWKGAGLLGLSTALAALMFLVPQFLHTVGKRYNVAQKESENLTKNIIRKAA